MYALERFKYLLPQSKVKLSLTASFFSLMLLQILFGFKYFDDYLIIFIFTLFLNDQFIKYKYSDQKLATESSTKNRIIVSIFISIMVLLPTILDKLNVTYSQQLFFFKLCFILWGQVFLLDAFIHYKETHSKQWLIFANTAMMMIFLGAFAI